jgi:hypothetical protein
MADKTWWERIEAKGGAALDQLTHLINEGNVRRVRVRQKERVVAEFPLTVGVVGAVLAPPLAAIGAVVALLTECSIEVEREASEPSASAASPVSTSAPAATTSPGAPASAASKLELKPDDPGPEVI